MRSTRRKTSIDPALAAELSRRARAQGRPESRLIADAIGMMLSDKTEAAIKADEATVKRQLNRIEARLDALFAKQASLQEHLLLFVRVWLEHNPPLDDDLADAAAMSAQARFEHFLDLSVHDFTYGDSDSDDGSAEDDAPPVVMSGRPT